MKKLTVKIVLTFLMTLTLGLLIAGCGEVEEETPLGLSLTDDDESKAQDEVFEKEKKIPTGIEVTDDVMWLEATGEVIEDSAFMIDADDGTNQEPTGSFCVMDYAAWEKICETTTSSPIKEQKDKYGEAFFEENMLICAITTTSAGYQYEFEGCGYFDDDKEIIVYVSYATDRIRNTLASYFVFVPADKTDEFENVDKISLYAYER